MVVERVSRRGFIGGTVAVAAAACAPAAAPVQPAAEPQRPLTGWEKDWADLTAAAKKEGKVTIFSTAGTGYRKTFDAFEKAFPGIDVEHVQGASSEAIVPKLIEERKAGVYTLDLLVGAGGTVFLRLFPDAFDPLRPALIRPDIQDDKVWRNGFEDSWLDNQHKYGFPMEIALTVWGINTNQVRDGEIQKMDDLLDPKWKGRIIMLDVRSGSTYAQMTGLRLASGEEKLRQLIVDQQPFFTRDPRQMVEGLVRDKYAIANNVNESFLEEFRQAGLGQNVRKVRVKDAMHSSSAGALWLVNKAPHPNAGKLMANWLLTKEGQEIYSKNTGRNSLRNDVETVDPVTMPEAGAPYFSSAKQDATPEIEKTQALLNDYVGIKN